MNDNVTFDYVIIGAGAAGCVLANRLSEDPDTSVLILEAGGSDRSPYVRIPAGFAKLMGTKVNWIYDTSPQSGLNNRRIFLPQGKVLGGGTSINAMLYVRGAREDYDSWSDFGAVGWSYRDVLPYFIAQENNERLADRFHGTGGELNVADQIEVNPLSKAYVRGCQQMGIPYTADPNGASQFGVFYHQLTQRNGWRESASTAFLWPVLKRPNLTLMTGSTVTDLLLDKTTVVGAAVVHRRRSLVVRANNEVIVSAGAINSPKLLLQSGIGPAAELEEVGVRVKHDLPGVGKNLHDQLETVATAQSRHALTYDGQDRFPRAGVHGMEWMFNKTGPATVTTTQVGAFVNSSANPSHPDIQLHFIPAQVLWEEGGHRPARVPGHGVTVLACHIRPQSRGEVRLASGDPMRNPVVDPGYLTEASDVDYAIDGMNIARDSLRTPAMREVLTCELTPGAEVNTRAEVLEHIRRSGRTDYHPVGTCRMGTDDMAVVDSDLRVQGLVGVRVIDSSVMPRIISGNTQAPSMMIGAKGADLVRGRSLPTAADA